MTQQDNYENVKAGKPCQCGSSNITQKMTLYVDPTDLSDIDICDGYMEDEYYCEECGFITKEDTEDTRRNCNQCGYELLPEQVDPDLCGACFKQYLEQQKDMDWRSHNEKN